MEENEEIFKVRERLSGLQIQSGFRYFIIYFTDLKMYVIETGHTSHHRNMGWGFLMNMTRTKISSEKQYSRFEKMDDTREIINSTTWFRTYPYENIIAMWIEEGRSLNELWFEVIQPENRRKYFGDEDGEDCLYFRKELTDEYVRILKKMLGYKFHGIKKMKKKGS